MKLNINIGSKERVARIVIGLILTALAFVGPANPWFLLGLIPVVTGVVGWCPPYQMLGINTRTHIHTHKHPKTPSHT